MTWKPISEAPLEGRILLYGTYHGTDGSDSWEWQGMEVGEHNTTCWTQYLGQEDYSCRLEPTHWQPLPDPPEES